MLARFLTVLAGMLLVGCATAPNHSDSFQKWFKDTANGCWIPAGYSPEEALAWQTALKSNEYKACWELPLRSTAIADCMEPLLERYIRPVTFSADALDSYIAGYRAVIQEFEAGEINENLFDERETQVQGDYYFASRQARAWSAFSFYSCQANMARRTIPADYPDWGYLEQYLIDTQKPGRHADATNMPVQDVQLAAQQSWLNFAKAANAEQARRNEQAKQKNAAALQALGAGLLSMGSMGRNSWDSSEGSRVGLYKGKSTAGMNTVCYYSVAGSIYTKNLNGPGICPLNARF